MQEIKSKKFIKYFIKIWKNLSRKRKFVSFATEFEKTKVKQNISFIFSCMVKEYLISILNVLLGKKIDTGEVLIHSLIFIPLSLSHVDRGIHKSSKPGILHYLKLKIISTQPDMIDVTVANDMFFFHIYLNYFHLTYVGLARHLVAGVLLLVVYTSYLLFGKPISALTKDRKREARSAGSGHVSHKNKGSSRKRPSNWYMYCKA